MTFGRHGHGTLSSGICKTIRVVVNRLGDIATRSGMAHAIFVGLKGKLALLISRMIVYDSSETLQQVCS